MLNNIVLGILLAAVPVGQKPVHHLKVVHVKVPQPVVVENTNYRVDTFVGHYLQMVGGQPTYASFVIAEWPYYTREQAVARAREIIRDGLCWGEAVVTCYPVGRVQKVVVQETDLP